MKKIVFLGINRNPLSVVCLEALAQTGSYQILVGIDRRRSLIERFKVTWRSHSLAGLTSRAISKLVQKGLGRGTIRSNAVESASSLIEVAELRNYCWFECLDVNNGDEQKLMADFEPDLMVVASFSQIIRSKSRSIARSGAINVHPSLLPKYRGPVPIYWVLRNGESQTGVTIHRLSSKVDAGDIVRQQEFPISKSDNEATLQLRASEVGARLLGESVEALLAGSIECVPQEETQASYFGFP